MGIGNYGKGEHHRVEITMQRVSIFEKMSRPTVLCLGAHPDDIEIGTGGTILRIQQIAPKAMFHWIVFSGNEKRKIEAQKSAKLFLANAQYTLKIADFKESYFKYNQEIKDSFESLKNLNPDLILTHFQKDGHQDHRVISYLTWQTFRNHLILEYEIPKFDSDLGNPNFFVELTNPIVEKKIELITQVFQSQKEKYWFCPETFRAIMRIRGIQSKAKSQFSEGYYSKKMIF